MCSAPASLSYRCRYREKEFPLIPRVSVGGRQESFVSFLEQTRESLQFALLLRAQTRRQFATLFLELQLKILYLKLFGLPDYGTINKKEIDYYSPLSCAVYIDEDLENVGYLLGAIDPESLLRFLEPQYRSLQRRYFFNQIIVLDLRSDFHVVPHPRQVFLHRAALLLHEGLQFTFLRKNNLYFFTF